MLHGILVGAGSILLAGAAVELFRLMRKQPSSATVAATNAQTLQQPPTIAQPVVQQQQAQPAIQSVAQQAVDLANSQQDTSGPTGDQGVPAGTLDPAQQAQIAANIAQTQAQIQAGNPPRDNFQDPTGLQTSANGPNTNGGALTSSDPTLVQQAQNILGI